VAAVATAFPSGRAAMDIKLADTRDAVEAGADEIDMVIDRGAFDQEVTTHRVTEASVRPWASDGALRHILTGPFDQWAYEYFIGVQG